MAATAVLAAALPCPGCRGGGEVNGLTCRECRGKGRQAGRVRAAAGLAALARRWADSAAVPAGKLVGAALHWSATVPGIAGAAGVTVGAAMIVHGVFHQVPELGVAAAVGGVFGLLADRRL